ncbi:MAG: hypothetical protein JO241_03455, partial [Candidatus Eremiobacteraeota bacterium]|nr:hypothetical protein [Candidatus Eremiobacteraeota bacterium]
MPHDAGPLLGQIVTDPGAALTVPGPGVGVGVGVGEADGEGDGETLGEGDGFGVVTAIESDALCLSVSL